MYDGRFVIEVDAAGDEFNDEFAVLELIFGDNGVSSLSFDTVFSPSSHNTPSNNNS